jgi:ATP-dependent helicase Lhr and Lhr-like helicase
VCQIGSPRSIAVLRQRIGRANHSVGGTPKGRLFALTRDDLIECAAGVRAMRKGRIDRPMMLEAPLDILAQQLVATSGTGEVGIDDAWQMVKRAAPYAELERPAFDQVIDMLGEGVATRRGRSGAHLHVDRINGKLRGRRGARLTALTSGGAIPDKADYAVIEDTSEQPVGTLDEDFAIESMAGDIFLLGSHSWRVKRVENGRVRVEDAQGLPPSVPFWNGEGLARSFELSQEVSELRSEIWSRIDDSESAIAWLIDACALDRAGAQQALDYVAEGGRSLGAVPTQTTVVAERFFDESGGMQLIVHAPFGARINRAWGMGLRKKFCRTFDFELQAAATDDAILLSLGPQHSFPLDSIFGFLHPLTLEETLTQAALQAPMFETRWRWNSTRALAVLRHTKGRRTPPELIRMRAADLLAAVFPAQAGCQDNHGGGPVEPPDHPLVNETMRDCLEEVMDTAGLLGVLESLKAGRITTLARDTVAPSPFSHGILQANPYAFLDDAPLEERRTRAVSMARPGELAARDADLLRLDPDVIAQVIAEAQPEPRDPDELHDLLSTVGLIDARPDWSEWLDKLVAENRAGRLLRDGRAEAWLCAERVSLVKAAFPDAQLQPAGLGVQACGQVIDGAAAARALVGGWLQSAGPTSAAKIAASLGLSEGDVGIALAALESDGLVLQGAFVDGDGPLQWCERRLLQRIHRLTLGQLREQIKPVPPSELMRFVLRWQHVHTGTRLHGPEGLLRVIEQLEGIELPPAAWEREVLPARIEGYQPAWLDELCLSGEVAWARLRVEPPQPDEKDEKDAPRGMTGKIGLFLRAHAPWLVERDATSPSGWAHLSPLARRVAELLEKRGAAFAAEIASGLQEPGPEIEDALWELSRTGAVSSDGFSGLRALLAPRGSRPTHAKMRTLQGRWSLLHRDAPPRTTEDGPFGDGSPVELAHLYLRRYGVVVREFLARESAAPPWRELVRVFRRLEARGEIRGGRFVSGPTGEQFALPEAIEALRAMGRSRGGEEVSVPAVDPLNLVGILTTGPRVPAVPGHRVVYHDGVPAQAVRSLA